MALNLYRRHRRDCKLGHPEDLRTSDLDERRKGWKRCECPIVASGTLARKFRRQTTGQWEWTDAKATAKAWEASGSWDGQTPQPLAILATLPDRISVTEATQAFLDRCRIRGIQPGTLAKYKTFTNQLDAFAASRGYVYIDQLTVSDMDAFYASWKDGIRTRAKKLDRLKSFVKFLPQAQMDRREHRRRS